MEQTAASSFFELSHWTLVDPHHDGDMLKHYCARCTLFTILLESLHAGLTTFVVQGHRINTDIVWSFNFKLKVFEFCNKFVARYFG